MLCAFDIKSTLADYLIEQDFPGSILATEVPFCHGFRRADMLYMKQGKIHAFEIKSDLDSLEKLEQQIEDYRNTFSFCWVVTTAKYLKKARRKIPNSVGLIIANHDGNARIIREARENKRLSKNNLVFFLEKNQLVNLMKKARVFPKKKVLEIGRLREMGEKKLTAQQLSKASYETLFGRYKKAYDLFRFDRGSKTTHDDIYYLSGAK